MTDITETYQQKLFNEQIEYISELEAIALLTLGEGIPGINILAIIAELSGAFPNTVDAFSEKNPEKALAGLALGIIGAIILGDYLTQIAVAANLTSSESVFVLGSLNLLGIKGVEDVVSFMGSILQSVYKTNPLQGPDLPSFFTLQPSSLAAGQNNITAVLVNGQEIAHLSNFPPGAANSNPGELDLLLNNDQVPVILYKDSWLQLTYAAGDTQIQSGNNGSFLSLVLGNSEMGARNGEVMFHTSTGEITVTGDDGTNFTVKDADILTVTGKSDGGTTLGVGIGNSDLAATRHQIILQSDSNGDTTTLNSNIGNATLTLGSGTDTFYHLAAGTTVVESDGTFVFSVAKGSLDFGPQPNEGVTLSASDFAVNDGQSLVSSNDDQPVTVENANNAEDTAGTGKDILVAIGTDDYLTASGSGQALVGLGGDLLTGGSGDTFVPEAGDNLIKITEPTLTAPTTIDFDPTGGNDVIENAELQYNLFGDSLPYAPDSSNALQNYVINFGSLTPSDVTFVGIIDMFWYGGENQEDFRLGYVQVNSTGATLVLPDGRVGIGNYYASPDGAALFDLPDSVKFIFDNGQEVYTGSQIISELYDNFRSSDDVTFSANQSGDYTVYLPPNDNIKEDPEGGSLTETPWAPYLSGSGQGVGGYDPAPQNLLTALTNFGAAADPLVDGSAGGLVIVGQPGTVTTVTYADAASGVTVDLATETSAGGGVASDILINVQNVIGSAFDDTLIGDGSGNTLIGGAGNDTLISGGGNATLIGGSGNNVLDGTGGIATADYVGAPDAVTVDLNTGVAENGYGGTDTLTAISNVVASGTGDTLIGDSGAGTLVENGSGNLLEAGTGTTELVALSGSNTLVGGTGDDSFVVAGGDNTLIGGSGSTTVDYTNAGANITVDLSAGYAASSSFYTNDTLSGIAEVIAAGTGDTLIGGSGADTLIDGGGSDLLEAGSGPSVLEATGSGNTLVGGSGNDTFVLGSGGNTVDGGSGNNTVDYSYASSAVTVDLSGGWAASSGFAGTDTLSDVADVVASGFDDTLIGDSGNNVLIDDGVGATLIGAGGDNTLIGTGGVVTADYAGASAGVTVDLSQGLAYGNGYGGTDTLIGISDVIGSAEDDTLVGDGGAASGSNVLEGGAGDDTLIALGSGSLGVSGGDVTLIGAGGDNTLIGTGAVTTADYAGASAGVTLDLSTGVAENGDGGTDMLIGISNVIGSAYGDTLVGDGGAASGSNVLVGGAGDDTLIALGSESLGVSGGIVTLIGAGGDNTLIGTGVVTTADYAGAPDAVTVDLSTGVAENGYGGTDTLTAISSIIASGTGDTLIGGSGTDTLTEEGSGDLLEAGSGTAVLQALSGGNTLVGGAGDDSFAVAGGDNTLIGGTGTTTVDYTGAGSAVTVDLSGGWAASSAFSSDDTLSSITGIVAAGTGDTLSGGSGAETLTEYGNGDLLEAGSGASVLEATGSGNTLVGGSGNDTFVLGSGGNTVEGGTGVNTVDYANVTASVAVNLATGLASSSAFVGSDHLSGIANVIVTGDGNFVEGDADTNTLSVTSGDDNTLVAGTGAATLTVVGNSNTLIGGNGVADLSATGNDNTLVASSGNADLTVSGNDNVLVAGSGQDTLDVLQGDGDTLVAGSGTDTFIGSFDRTTVLSFANSTAGVTVDLTTGSAVGTGIGVDSLANIDDIIGSNFADTLIGDNGDDVFTLGTGADTVVGSSEGQTTVSYAAVTGGVTVDLSTGIASGPDISGDVLSNVDAIIGSAGTDTLIAGSANVVLDGGSGGDDTFVSGTGNDTLIGSATGNNTVSYAAQSTGMVVNLAEGTATSIGGDKTDTLANVQNVIGSATGDDTITAGSQSGTFIGGSGDEEFIASAASGTFLGGSGNNTVSFQNLNVGMTADLNTGVAVSAAGQDYSFSNIENLTAGGGVDTLIGNAGDNVLQASSGDAMLIGGAGDNTLIGGTADYAGAPGAVTVDLSYGEAENGYGGTDFLEDISTVIGSAFGSTLIGDGESNVLEGGAGNDTLIALGSGYFEEYGGAVTLIGGDGDNVLIGTDAAAEADYAGAPDPVTVDLSTGLAENGYGGTDTLIGIDEIVASGPDNTLVGNSNDDTFVITGGGNTVVGGSGITTLDYTNPDYAVTVDLAAGWAASTAFSSDDSLAGITNVIAEGVGDTLIGTAGTATLADSGGDDLFEAGSGATVLQATGSGNTLVGGSGDDTFVLNDGGNTVEGGSGDNTLDFAFGASPLTVDLSTGLVQSSGFIGTDTLSNVEDVAAYGYGDTLIGDSGNNVLIDEGEDDTLIGAGGNNTLISSSSFGARYTQIWADYANAPDGVTVDLSTGIAENGYGGTDALIEISNVIGPSFDSTLIGTGESNTLVGGTGNDVLIALGSGSLTVGGGDVTLIGAGGDNTLVGTGAVTTADYAAAPGAVVIDLSTGLAENGYGGTDTLIGISSVIGSSFDNTLIGNGESNTLEGGAGNDTLIALGSGPSTLSGGVVTLIGDAGNNVLIGTGATATAYYVGAPDPVVVDLATGFAANGYGGTDTLNGIASVVAYGTGDTLIGGAGSQTLTEEGGGDLLEGGLGPSVLEAFGGDNTLIGGSGNDSFAVANGGNTLVGGSGTNTADYTNAGYAVTVDLSAGYAAGDDFSGVDTLTGINTVLADGPDDTLIGGSEAETLWVNGGFQNTLIAGTGNQLLYSSGSNDTLIGGPGTDTLFEAGDGILEAGSGPTVLEAPGGDNTFVGGSGPDTFEALGGSNTLIGGSDTNTFVVAGGDNTLTGGSGTNIADYANVDSPVTVDLSVGEVFSTAFPREPDTLSGIAGVIAAGSGDTLIGGTGAVTLIDSGGSDLLEAGSGPSVLEATGSGNTLVGGSGDGTFVLGSGGNTVMGGSGNNTLDYTDASSAVTVDLSAGWAASSGFSAADTLSDIANVIGSGFDDTLIGDSGNNVLVDDGVGATLIGAGGDNTLVGIGGVVTADYVGASDAVTVDLGTGVAENGYGGTDTLIGISEVLADGTSDTLIGGADADALTEEGTGDLLEAGSGTTVLQALAGGNTVVGGAGDDSFVVAGGDNTLIGGSGTTTVDYANVSSAVTVDLSAGWAASSAFSGDDTLSGITGIVATGTGDTLIGGTGTQLLLSDGHGNTLIAGEGDTTLASTGTDDTLVGDADGATLLGSAGNSTVALYTLYGMVVNLVAGTAAVGSGTGDTLIDITNAVLAGDGGTLLGGSGADTLTATQYGSTLIAGTGDDTLLSPGGYNTLIGGGGTDILDSSDDENVLIAGTGETTLITSGTSDTLLGGSGADTLISSGYADTLLAGSGNSDLLASGDGNTLIGGSGSDVLSSDEYQNTLIAGSGVNTLSSSGSYDTLIGGDASDTLISTGYENTLFGGSGANLLSSGGDQDVLIAGTGTTTLVTTGYADTLYGGGGTNVLIAEAYDDTLIAGEGESTLLASGGDNTLIGNSGTDTLSSSDDENVLIAGGGPTVLSTSGTSDTLYGGSGTDSLSSSGSADTLIAGDGDSTLTASGGSNTLIGGSGTDFLSSSEYQNLLVAGNGTTTLSSSGSYDRLVGGSAADTLDSTGYENTLIAGAGDNDLTTSGTDDTLLGGSGTDTLSSTGYANTLIAGSGANMLSASETGTLVGGAGVDTLIGSGEATGGLADYYQFGSGDGQTTIINGATGATSATNELDFLGSLSDEDLWFLQSGNNLQIDILGTSSDVSISNWFSGAANQLQEITADGLEIDSHVSDLVSAMATYSEDNPGFNPTTATSMPTDTTLQNAIAASWHTA